MTVVKQKRLKFCKWHKNWIVWEGLIELTTLGKREGIDKMNKNERKWIYGSCLGRALSLSGHKLSHQLIDFSELLKIIVHKSRWWTVTVMIC